MLHGPLVVWKFMARASTASRACVVGGAEPRFASALLLARLPSVPSTQLMPASVVNVAAGGGGGGCGGACVGVVRTKICVQRDTC